MTLNSMSDQISVSYITMSDEKLAPSWKIIMSIRHNSSLYAMFRLDTRITNLVHCVLTHAVTFVLQYDVQFLQARTSDNACNKQSSQIIPNASLSMCRR